MLSERERRILARIERQLIESDPDLAHLFATARPRRPTNSLSTFLLVVGLTTLVLGSVVAAVPIAITGMALSLFALFTAHTRPSGLGRPGVA